MRYELRLTAYDVMDQVWVSTTLHLTEDTPGATAHPVLHWQSAAPGTGSTDPRVWARDALLTAMEDI